MSEDFDKIQHELDCLTETSAKINECQNQLQQLEESLKVNREIDKKTIVDLRLKYGSKIDEANEFYKSLSDVDKEKLKMKLLQKQLSETQEILSISLSEISPDISDSKSNEIKHIREKINEIKLDIHVSSVNIEQKSNVATAKMKKYKRSIELSKAYFSTKERSLKSTQFMVELINKYRDEMNRYRHDYSTHMSNLEKISSEIHLQRSTQSLVESRLSQPLPECDLASIGSFNLDDDNDGECIASTISSNLSLSQRHLHCLSNDFSNESNLPSPCRSINIPFNQSAGTVVSRTTNISWHPLL